MSGLQHADTIPDENVKVGITDVVESGPSSSSAATTVKNKRSATTLSVASTDNSNLRAARRRKTLIDAATILEHSTHEEMIEAVKRMPAMDQRLFLGRLANEVTNIFTKAFPSMRVESISNIVNPDNIRSLIGVDVWPFSAVASNVRGTSVRFEAVPVGHIDPRLAGYLLSDVGFRLLSSPSGGLSVAQINEYMVHVTAVHESTNACLLAMNPAAGHATCKPFTTCWENDANHRKEIYTAKATGLAYVNLDVGVKPDTSRAAKESESVFYKARKSSDKNQTAKGRMGASSSSSSSSSSAAASTAASAAVHSRATGNIGVDMDASLPLDQSDVSSHGDKTVAIPPPTGRVQAAGKNKTPFELTATNPFIYSSNGSITKRPTGSNARASKFATMASEMLGLASSSSRRFNAIGAKRARSKNPAQASFGTSLSIGREDEDVSMPSGQNERVAYRNSTLEQELARLPKRQKHAGGLL